MNQNLTPQARQALQRFKLEVATELGIANYDQVDKGALPARLHGQVGGTMVKRLVTMAEEKIGR